MTLRRGITILDLIDQLPPGAQGFVPAQIAEFLESLAIVDLESSTSGEHYVHRGQVQSLVEAGLKLGNDFPLELPGLNKGLRFQFSCTRASADTDAGENLEPKPSAWQLDLVLDRLAIPFVGQPATRVPAAPARPPHLLPDPSKTRVMLYGRGVLRIAGGADGTSARLITDPDPFDPDAPIGAVLEFGLDPNHLLLGSGIGMTVGKVIWDNANEYTPPEIEARGHSPSWKGLSVSEATLYLPRGLPVLGDVSLGVRDLLIGDPGGVQLEANLALGTPAQGVQDFQYFQQIDDQVHNPTPIESGLARTLTLHEQTGATARVRIKLSSGAIASWTFPGGKPFRASETGWFSVRPNSTDVLKFQSVETNDEGKEVLGPEVVYRFVANPPVPVLPIHPPVIRASVSGGEGATWLNVVHMSGDALSFAGLSFKAEFVAGDAPSDPSAAQALIERTKWELKGPNGSQTAQGEFYTPDVGLSLGTYTLVIVDPKQRRRRLVLEILGVGQLIVGARQGPRIIDLTDTEGPVVPTALLRSFDLKTAHDTGELSPPPGPSATWDGSVLTVPTGVGAEVSVAIGSPEDPVAANPPTPPTVCSHLRIFMTYNEDGASTHQLLGLRKIVPSRTHDHDTWGPPRPYPQFVNARPTGLTNVETRQEFNLEQVKRWLDEVLAAVPDPQFVVVGRCCDLSPEHIARNKELARRRAINAASLLEQAGAPLGSILVRGEQDPIDSLLQQIYDSDNRDPGHEFEARTGLAWQIKLDYPEATRSTWNRDQPQRQEARGADIYVYHAYPAPQSTGTASDESTQAPALRITRVPGDDFNPATPVEVDSRSAHLPFSVEVLARWDSPTYVDNNDAIPTLVQLTFDWQSRALEVPGGGEVELKKTDGTLPTHWRVIGRFSHDPRGGATELAIALDTPGDDRGIATLDGDAAWVKVVAAALGFGPALLGGVTSASPENTAVRFAALTAAIVAVTSLGVIEDGQVTMQRAEARFRLRDLNSVTGLGFRLHCDYDVILDINANKLGLKTDKPIKIRYKNVGIEIDNDPAKSGFECLNLVYDDADFEIVDPGKWKINGWLGKLLGISAVRFGTGSIWFEVELGLALDLGVVEVSSATIRIRIDGPDIEVDLRGLAATIDIPNTVVGKGQLQVADDGAVSAALDLNILPADLKVNAGLKYEDGMTQLEAGVRFATGIPLAGTGLGVFGFVGRFVSNGTRALNSSITDPVERELDWFGKAPFDKYEKSDGQFAMGLGAVVGTLPDAGFTFSADAMLVVEAPDPSVVFSLDATLAKPNTKTPAEQGPGIAGDVAAKIIGLIAVDPQGLVLGVRGTFEVPKLLRVSLPISAYFPFQRTGLPGYLRIGSDGFEGRAGQPISLTTLPGILDQEAWSYFMVEEKQLLRLGGDDEMSFQGFSIGFGAGWELFWGSSRIHLSASAAIRVGIGTRPLTVMGKVTVKGELWLVVAGVSAKGEMLLRVVDQGWQLKGEFCGKISCFFFSIEGCVSFELGSDPTTDPPDPEPLVSGVSLTDKFARIVAEGSTGAPGPAHIAWPDAVPVLHFKHPVQVQLAADSFQPSVGWPGPGWVGTTKLKYLYRLLRVELLDANNQLVHEPDWPCMWWMPAFRASVPESGDAPAGEQEGWDLALLSWDPAPWSRNLPNGGEGLDADPADNLGRLCEPLPHPGLHSALGLDLRRRAVDRTQLATPDPGTLPFSPFFDIQGVEGRQGQSLADVVALAIANGLSFVPGIRVALPAPFEPPRVGSALAEGYQLPRLFSAQRSLWSLQWDARYTPAVVDPDLVLMLCMRLDQVGDHFEVCVDFSHMQVGVALPSPYGHERLVLTDSDDNLRTTDVLPYNKGDDSSEISFGNKGLTVDLPGEVNQITVAVGWIEGPPVRIQAFDFRGVQVGEVEASPDVIGTLETLQLQAPGTVKLVFSGGGGTGAIGRICYFHPDHTNVEQNQIVDLLVHDGENQPVLPQVFGELDGVDGGEIPWVGEILEATLHGNLACIFVHYAPTQTATWAGVRVGMFPFFDVRVLSTTATSVVAQRAWEQAEEVRENLHNDVDTAANGDEEDRHIVLAADTVYKIRLVYSAAAWQHDANHPEPPTPATLDWDNPPGHIKTWTDQSQTFQFRTAAEGPVADEHVLSFDRQETFDVRALRRYLLGFEPAGTRPVTFLDDSLWIHFAVEWVETLASRYGYALELTVSRTDPSPPAPGELLGELDLGIDINWGPLPFPLQEPADQNIAVALDGADCIAGVPQEGSSAEVIAPLEPDVDYDLVLWATRGQEKIEVGRSHFHTSRYHNASELVAALGFRTPDEALYPFDFLATGTPPTDPRLGEDQALDDALAGLGMDPWPLPAGPRTVLIWRFDQHAWTLVAALLDSDESMVRGPRREGNPPPGTPPDTPTPDRFTVEGMRVFDPSSGPVGTLKPRRSNSMGTRVLFVATTPLIIPDSTDSPRLILSYRDRGVTHTGSRFINAIPHLIVQEQS